MLSKQLISKSLYNPAATRAFSVASKDFFYKMMQHDEIRAAMKEEAEKFALAKIAPIAAEVDHKDEFPRHLWP